jgi:hypothetical protein
MRQPDLERALHHLGVVHDLFAEHSGGVPEPRLLGAIELLSGSIARLLPDCLCQQKLADLRMAARAFYSERDHLRCGRPPLSGLEYLRLQILKDLNALDGRIRRLYKIRLTSTAEHVLSPSHARPARPALRAVKKA